jgi:hypothetical protein
LYQVADSPEISPPASQPPRMYVHSQRARTKAVYDQDGDAIGIGLRDKGVDGQPESLRTPQSADVLLAVRLVMIG